MRSVLRPLVSLIPAFAVFAGASAGASGGAGEHSDTGANATGGPAERALSLAVDEQAGSVAVELIAHSPIVQQVSYEAELVGNSRSRHRGNTALPAHERQVLSRLRTSVSGTWCARVDVTEAGGARYTLTAGDCGAA